MQRSHGHGPHAIRECNHPITRVVLVQDLSSTTGRPSDRSSSIHERTPMNAQRLAHAVLRFWGVVGSEPRYFCTELAQVRVAR